MGAMTREQALGYLRRWELVREVEAAELRRTSVAAKFRQLAALMASRHMLPDEPSRHREVEIARDHWARLRKVLGA
jgi:hypothetical protein